MEWEGPAIVLDVRPYGESDVLATVMTEAQGAHRGLAKGGQSRARAAMWQPGNLLQVRWVGRLSDQLGSLAAEMIHPTAAAVMDDALLLSMLRGACAVAEGALLERMPHPAVFDGLLHLLARLPSGPAMLTDQVAWEVALLAALGYGLDLTSCAVTGRSEGLVGVSPRTGRAVSAEGAGIWASRLLPLPAFLQGQGRGDPPQWRDGLRLTGHFLERDAFGHHHRPLPPARIALYQKVTDWVQETDNAG